MSEKRCPLARWWWPWHRWRFDGRLTSIDAAGYFVMCKRCKQGRRVYA